jgi:competence protein ComEC
LWVPEPVGEAELLVIGPVDHVAVDQVDSSRQNDSSLVIMVRIAGLRLLLTGDFEPPGQQAILDSGADLQADVLKIPHHGSAQQDPSSSKRRTPASQSRVPAPTTITDHPAPRTLQLVRSLGMTVLRTDENGSVAVRLARDRLAAVTQQ